MLLSAQGRLFDQAMAERLSAAAELLLICGRYEGVDERVAEHLADEELSIGDYVLSGGELAAAVVIDVIARLLPGVLGNDSSRGLRIVLRRRPRARDSRLPAIHAAGRIPRLEGAGDPGGRQPRGDPRLAKESRGRKDCPAAPGSVAGNMTARRAAFH